MKQLVIAFGFLFCLFAVSSGGFAHEGMAQVEMAPVSGESIYNLSSKWTNQDGKEVNISSLRGHPAVVAMVYTSCKMICPVITEQMKAIDEALPPSLAGKVNFVLFSFDSVRDTPQQLKKFAQMHDLDLGHWTLLHGGDKEVRDLAAALGILYRRDEAGDFDHSTVITVLDSEGVIRHQHTGTQPGIKECVDVVLQQVNLNKK